MVLETNTDGQLLIQDEFSYMPENLSGYAKGKFKYSETLSIVMIGEDVYIIEHTDLNKTIQVPLKGDGYYHVEYIVIPTKKWYDSALEKLSEFDVEIIDDIPSINYKKIKENKIKVQQK